MLLSKGLLFLGGGRIVGLHALGPAFEYDEVRYGHGTAVASSGQGRLQERTMSMLTAVDRLDPWSTINPRRHCSCCRITTNARRSLRTLGPSSRNPQPPRSHTRCLVQYRSAPLLRSVCVTVFGINLTSGIRASCGRTPVLPGLRCGCAE